MSNNVGHKTKTIVLTGSTGAFGRYLAFELIKYEDVQIILLVRGKTQEEAQNRIKDIIGEKHYDRIDVLKSDLTEQYLGLTESDYKDIASRTTHILHSAASIRFTLPIEEARIHNVKTTEGMIDFAKECPNLVRFGFVSTALVAGKRSGLIKEDEFEHNAGFKNTYEQTKYEAEALVRASSDKFPITIFRPPLILTAPSPEEPPHLTNFLYLLISLIAQELLPFVPGTEKSTMDIVNAFDAARVIIKLMMKEHLSHTTYHITNGVRVITVDVLHRMIEDKMGKRISIKYCRSIESCLWHVHKAAKSRPEIQIVYKRAASFLSEPAYPKVFDNISTLSELNINQLGEDPVDTLSLVFDNKLWNSSV